MADAIQTEIHRKAMENIVNEMALTLVRTSGSPVVTDAKDFSTCLLDEAGEQLALSSYILLHSSTAWLNTDAVIKQLARDQLEARPGDGWIVNDPYCGSQHQGDVGIVTPMFYRSDLIGWAFSNLHVLDIGGMGVSGSAPAAVSVFDEALRFGAIRIIRAGQIDDEWKRYIGQNVRTPGPVLNDIRSMIAANNVAQGKLVDVLDRFGLEAHRAHNERNKLLTEELLRRRIEAMADGRYEAVEYIEFDANGPDELIQVRCTLTVSGSELQLSFTGDPQIDAPVNGTSGSVLGGVMTHIVTMLGYGDLPFNGGMWRPLAFDLGPEGTVVNARPPAPVSLGHGEAGYRCGKAARNVLNQAASLSNDATLRSRVSGIASDALAAACLFGKDRDGAPAVMIYMDTITGVGGGAQTGADGQDMYGSSCMAGSGLPDVEVHEATDPVLFLWRRISQNSGGAGQRRGGQGLDQAYLLHGGSSFAGFTTITCAEFPPPGFGGGFPPSTGQQYPIRSTRYQDADAVDVGQCPDEESLRGTKEVIGTKVGHFALNPGDVLRAFGGGGAGLGDPLFRDIRAVVKDFRDGYITAEHAEAAYGVVLRADGSEDPQATDRRRHQLRCARIGEQPVREATARAELGISVTLSESDDERWWSCAFCEAELAPVDQDWRQAVVKHELPMSEFVAELGMRVRIRDAAPAVNVIRSYCPACAGCLATDVLTDAADARSPVLAAPARGTEMARP